MMTGSISPICTTVRDESRNRSRPGNARRLADYKGLQICSPSGDRFYCFTRTAATSSWYTTRNCSRNAGSVVSAFSIPEFRSSRMV